MRTKLVRTQVLLTPEQHRRLRELAARRKASLSELVREGVQQILDAPERDDLWRRAREAVGAFRDPTGAEDVAERHDAYLAEVHARGKRVR